MGSVAFWFGAACRRVARPTTRAAAVVASTARRLGAVSRSLLPWVAVATVVTALALGALSWAGSRDDARATTSADSRRSGTADNDPRRLFEQGDGQGAGGVDARMAADAPRRDPVGLVQALADARATAWSSGVAARLVEVDAPRSPALARDTTVLAGVQRAQQRHVGLAFTVRDADVVADTGALVTIRVRIDTSAHVVRGPSDEVQRPAAAAEPVLLDVVRTDAGWRVHDVRPV